MAQFTDIQAADGAFQQLSMHSAKTKEDLAAVALYWSDQDVDQAKRVIKILISKLNGEQTMSEIEWLDSEIVESGNFPKENFKDVLKAIYIAQNQRLSDALELKLEFESGKQIATLMFNMEKTRGVSQEGNRVIVDGKKISTFISSIEKIDAKTGMINMNNNDPSITHIKTQWAFLDGVPTGFRTIPDLVGCTLHMIATLDKVGDDQQTSKFPNFTVRQIDGLQDVHSSKPTPAPTLKPAPPGKAKPAPKPAASADSEMIDSAIYDTILLNPLPISGIYKQFGGKAKSPYQPGDLRVSLDRMKTQGKVIQTGDNFEGV